MTIIVKINNVEGKQYKENEDSLNCLCENVHKTDKFVQPDQESRGRKNYSVRNEKEDTTKTLTIITKMMITASWKELYSIEVENLDKIDKISPLKKKL